MRTGARASTTFQPAAPLCEADRRLFRAHKARFEPDNPLFQVDKRPRDAARRPSNGTTRFSKRTHAFAKRLGLLAKQQFALPKRICGFAKRLDSSPCELNSFSHELWLLGRQHAPAPSLLAACSSSGSPHTHSIASRSSPRLDVSRRRHRNDALIADRPPLGGVDRLVPPPS